MIPTATKIILIVDENPLVLSVLTKIFGENAWVVRSASDGFAALASIRSQLPDILISDLNMVGMSGFELLFVVRRRFPHIAVIAMSGAYCGESVLTSIAADAFYAKDGAGVRRLLELVSGFKVDSGLTECRSAVPVWIPSTGANTDSAHRLLVACPECLRPFSCITQETDEMRHKAKCPHRSHHMRVALVGCLEKTDHTLPFRPVREQRPGLQCATGIEAAPNGALWEPR